MNYLEFYQNIPQYIDPIAFLIGSFAIRWYSLMWIVGIGVVYIFLSIQNKKNNLGNCGLRIADYELQNLFFYLTAGALIGGRLGYVLFYNFPYYLNNLLEIFFPIKITGYGLLFTGYYGLSYFGGLVGVVLAGYFFSRKRRINFWQLADFVALAIPMGYFFGRIGNFLNGELYGRPTNMFWGMNFGDGLLRHPSQFYEAFFEGLILFGIIFLVRRLVRTYLRTKNFSGILFLAYIFGYSFFRFFLEFFREPDKQIGFILEIFTLGQIFSVFFMATVFILYRHFHNKNKVI